MPLAPEATMLVDVPLVRPKVVPVGATVEVAIVARTVRPVVGDFRPADWVTLEGRPNAEILVGPQAVPPFPLTAGTKDVWLRVDAAPEDAWVHAGTLTVG